MFAGALSQIFRYREFLEIILERYGKASQAFFENTKVLLPGNHPISESQQKVFNEGRKISAVSPSRD